MITLFITPTHIYLRGVTDEQRSEISNEFVIEKGEKGYFIKGNPTELYKALLKISYNYVVKIM